MRKVLDKVNREPYNSPMTTHRNLDLYLLNIIDPELADRIRTNSYDCDKAGMTVDAKFARHNALLDDAAIALASYYAGEGA